jgi:hypothetical protein
MDLVPYWVRAEEFLSWARVALEMGTPLGRDAAVCYAKRAVCRLIDSLMHYNHLSKWVGGTYPAKIEMLKKVGIEVKSVVHELVIGNRNDIEHNYTGATEHLARHAVEIAEMAMPPLVEEANDWATITLGLNYSGNFSAPDSTAPGGSSVWNFDWQADIPFVLVDYADSITRVMMIHRQDKEVRFAPLTKFDPTQAIQLAMQFREQRGGRGMSFGCNGPFLVDQLKSRLELTF